MTVVEISSLYPERVAKLDDEAISAVYSGDASWLRVNFVSSVDGAAVVDGRSGGLGGDADHRIFDILRRLCDVVLVGAGTVRTEGYGAMRVDAASEAARTAAGLAPHPAFAIVSGRLDLDPASPIFTDAPVRPIVVTTDAAPADRCEALGRVADVLVCGREDLDAVLMVGALRERGLARIHCEGGPSLFGTLLAADVVDELCITVSPLLVAGDSGRIATSARATPRGMALASVLESDGTLLLRYLRQR